MAESPDETPGTSNRVNTIPKTRRRNRIITSCLECRRRKLKCDKKFPCDHCHKASRECVFLAPPRDPNAQNRLNQLKDRVELIEKELEASLENSADSRWSISAQSTGPSKSKTESDSEGLGSDLLEPTPLAVDAVAYEGDEDDDTEDLGIQLGRMRLTERLGGSIRPMFSMEVTEAMRKGSNGDESGTPFAYHDTASPAEFLAPSKDYLSPGAGLAGFSSVGETLSLMDYLPSRQMANNLLQHYWARVHPIARVVHRPSFERQYLQFWNTIASGFEPTFSIQAIVLAALFSGAVSVPETTIQTKLGCIKKDLVGNLQTAAESALGRANFARTTKLETLQAFTMYLVIICGRELSRAHGAVVAMAVRLCQMAGLHKDGAAFGLLPVETHVRRLVFAQLTRLDLRTCQMLGPPYPSIREGEYNTELPLNVDDTDLEALIQPTKDAVRFTDNTLNVLRIELTRFATEIHNYQQKVDKRLTALSFVLKRIEEFFDKAEARYTPLLDESVPIQALTLLLMRMARSTHYIGLLHKYVVSAPMAMPARLVDIVWDAALTCTEIGVSIETDPRFEPWAWYAGSLQNYHVALVLFAELARLPDRPGADRAWKVLTFVFDLPPHLDNKGKLLHLAQKARSRMSEYERRRRRRLPVELQRSLGVTHWSDAAPPPESKDELPSPPPAPTGIHGQPLHRRPDLGAERPQHLPFENAATNSTAQNYLQPQASQQQETSGPDLIGDSQHSATDQTGLPDFNNFDNFAAITSLEGINWDEIDKFLQMDTSFDGAATSSDFFNVDASTATNTLNPAVAPTTTEPVAAPGQLPAFDASGLDEVSFPPVHMFPTPRWFPGPSEPNK